MQTLQEFETFSLQVIRKDTAWSPSYGWNVNNSDNDWWVITNTSYNLLVQMNELGLITVNSQCGDERGMYGFPPEQVEACLSRSYVEGLFPCNDIFNFIAKLNARGFICSSIALMKLTLLQRKSMSRVPGNMLKLKGQDWYPYLLSFPPVDSMGLPFEVSLLGKELQHTVMEKYHLVQIYDPIFNRSGADALGLFTAVCAVLQELKPF